MSEEKDVHTEHCCLKHGCKYGDRKCTVICGQKSQSYPCEECGPYDFLSDKRRQKILDEMIAFENGEGRYPTEKEIKQVQDWINNGLIWNLRRNLLNVFLLVRERKVTVPKGFVAL